MSKDRRTRNTAIAASLAAGALLLASVSAPRGASASENLNWGTGVELTAPANADEDPDVFLREVSCPTVGSCTAVGSYEIPPEHEEEPPREQGELLSETGGRWERGVEVAMPAGAASEPRVEFRALSCPSLGNCTAAGEYRDGAGDELGFLLDDSAGVWGSAMTTPLPADASAKPEVRIQALSCPSAGDCAVAGNYFDTAGQRRGFVVSETAGTWEAASAPALPANAVPNPNDRLMGISCAAPGYCTAVGSYEDGSAKERGLLWTETDGTWGPGVETNLPANAGSGSGSELRAVSCPAAESCTAVGEYIASSGHAEGFMLGETAGTWGAAVEAILPANASSAPGANVHEVQCVSAGNCTAVGIYTASSPEESDEGLFLTETAGVWGAGVERPLPADAGPQLVIEGSLSCVAAGECGYVGSYKIGEFISRPLLVTENDGSWGPGVSGQLPANATGDPGAFLSSVSCPSRGDCTAVGSYNSYTGGSVVERQGMVFTAAPTTASLSVSGPLGGAFAGSPIPAARISAALAGGSTPSGPITFTVFGPQATAPSSCASGGTVLGTADAYGDGTYEPSAGFTPPSPGDYWWYAGYGGDAGDEPSTSACGPGMAETTVDAKSVPTLAASGPIGGTAGSQIAAASITATLAGGTAPTGTITFTVYGPQPSPPSSCAAGGSTVGTAVVDGNGTYQPSAGFTPPSPGEYWWYAAYGGDAGDEPAASACGALMAQTLVAAAPVTPSGSGQGPGPGSGPGSGSANGTTAATPPTLSGVELGSRRLLAKREVALRFTLSQAATIEIVIAQAVRGHRRDGVCSSAAKRGRRCTTKVRRRTLRLSRSAGPHTLELALAGLGRGSYTATIRAGNAGGSSPPVSLTFALLRG